MVAMRSVFDRQLRLLENEVLRLAEFVETQLVEAMKALNYRDMDIARRVDAFDATVNKLRYEIEEHAYTLLALQQPIAGDMRRIVAAVSIATNLERMGDHAAGIARLAMRAQDTQVVFAMPMFTDMMRLANDNLRDAMIALSNSDSTLARQVVSRDKDVDRLHKAAYDELLARMIHDQSVVEYATMLLWVSHNIERFADRVSNICERIVYAITGNLYERRADPMP
jgi:phosphate transport system protein